MLIRHQVTLRTIRSIWPELVPTPSPVDEQKEIYDKTRVVVSASYASLLSEKERGIVVKSLGAKLNVGTMGILNEGPRTKLGGKKKRK